MKITAKIVTHQEVELEMEDVVNALKNSIRNYYNIPEGGYISNGRITQDVDTSSGVYQTIILRQSVRDATPDDRRAFMVMDFLDKIKHK
jgi:hypothetical protein